MALEQITQTPEAFNQKLSGRNLAAIGGLTLGATALLLDRGVPRFNHRHYETRPSLVRHQSDGEYDIYVFPGCRTDGRAIGRMLQPNFGQLGTTNYGVYPKSDFDIEPLKQDLLEARAQNADKSAMVVGFSMGKLAIGRFLQDETFRREFGPIKTLIADSSPASFEDVRRKTKMALHLARASGDSWTLHRMARAYTHRMARSASRCETDVSAAQLYEHFMDNAKTTTAATVAQGLFIARAGIKNADLSDVAEYTFYIHAPYDDVVDTAAAYRAYDAAYHGVKEVIDYNRPPVSHAAGVMYQRALVELLAGKHDDSAHDTATPLIIGTPSFELAG